MDLKKEIERNLKFKDNVITIKNQLNDLIVRGGGKQSNTLAETPQNLKDMVKDNYKKTATGMSDCPRVITIKDYIGKTFTINLNLTFEPKKVFLYCSSGNTGDTYIACTKELINHQLQSHTSAGSTVYFELKSFSKEKIEIGIISCTDNYMILLVEDWTAIE